MRGLEHSRRTLTGLEGCSAAAPIVPSSLPSFLPSSSESQRAASLSPFGPSTFTFQEQLRSVSPLLRLLLGKMPWQELPLPEGWEEARDYDIDHATKTTSWVDPRTVEEGRTGGGRASRLGRSLRSKGREGAGRAARGEAGCKFMGNAGGRGVFSSRWAGLFGLGLPWWPPEISGRWRGGGVGCTRGGRLQNYEKCQRPRGVF
ncbi:protein KIBRA [Crotalus adamanteus]|uniref:Protein KIBRA n=1 Tax=Crotalus adamanteus TaxID=8729 RepID=A0AAW1C9B9_CROAD